MTTIFDELAETARLVAGIGAERQKLARTVASMSEPTAEPLCDIPKPVKTEDDYNCPDCGDLMTIDEDGIFCERCQPCNAQPCPDSM